MSKTESTPSTKANCKACGKPGEIFSGTKNGQYYQDLCAKCVGTLGSSEFYRRFDRQSQRRTFAKDIVQPDENDFAKLYGADKAREHGWSDEEIRKYS